MEQPIGRVLLRDGDVSVAVLSQGASVQDWRVPLGGRPVPVVLGLPDPAAYRRQTVFLGAIVGRVANRIGGAAYMQGGRRIALNANDGRHQLHGGPDGLWAVNWTIDADGPAALRLSHVSPPGAGGFPGRVAFQVDMRLSDGCLSWDMQATPDQETPISLAQHTYFALGPARLTMHSHQRLARDAEGIMTGAILPDDRLAQGIALPQTRAEGGQLDDFFLFDPAPAQPLARVDARNGLRLRLWSDQPGAQVYTGQWLPDSIESQPIGTCAGFCIEPSGLPNALNIPAFPSILCNPDRPYRQRTRVEIAAATG